MDAGPENGFGVLPNGQEKDREAAVEMSSREEEAVRQPVAQWTVADVCAWIGSRPLGAPGGALMEAAHSHAISGKALLRLTEEMLERMGVAPGTLRQALLCEILHLRLQQEMEDLLDATDERERKGCR